MHLAESNHPDYDVRLYNYMPQFGAHDGLTASGFYIFVYTVNLLCPFIIYKMAENINAKLHNFGNSKHKGRVALFWSTATLSHLFNIYCAFKLVMSTCHSYRPEGVQKKNCTFTTLAIAYAMVTTSIVIFVHSKYAPSLRTAWRIVFVFSLYGIYGSVGFIVVFTPFQILLASANPHLYGFSILTVWSVILGCIILTSLPFTIAQVFVAPGDYKLTPKQGLKQVLLLILVAILIIGFGSLACSITLLLLLSKYGERTQSVTTSVGFVLRHAIIPLAGWMVQRGRWMVRQNINQLLNVLSDDHI